MGVSNFFRNSNMSRLWEILMQEFRPNIENIFEMVLEGLFPGFKAFFKFQIIVLRFYRRCISKWYEMKLC